MMPGVSIVVSFLGFAYIFAKKVYPTAIKALDGHIESIKNKIKEAELLKEEATLALEEAYAKKEGIVRLVEENKKASEERIERMRLENERYLKALREKFEISLEARLEAELEKQKNLLIEKLSNQIIERLSKRVGSTDVSIDLTKEDLQKLA